MPKALNIVPHDYTHFIIAMTSMVFLFHAHFTSLVKKWEMDIFNKFYPALGDAGAS